MKKISLFYLLFALGSLTSMPLSCSRIEINFFDVGGESSKWFFKEKNTTKIGAFKKNYEDTLGICAESQRLICNAKELENQETFNKKKIGNDSYIFLFRSKKSILCVKTKEGERKLIDFKKINANLKDFTIYDLKKKIKAQCKNKRWFFSKYNPSNQILRFKGKALTDKLTLSESKIKWGSIVQLSFKDDLSNNDTVPGNRGNTNNKMILIFIVLAVFIFTIAYSLGFFSSSETDKKDETDYIV